MTDTTNARQLVVFNLGDEHYALPIAHVHEIIRYTEPRSIVSRTGWVKGVISLRGQIIPVYDLAARLGVPSRLTQQAKIVIVDTGTETAGVIVDGVEEVLTIDGEQLQAAPGTDPSVVEAIAKVGERLIVLLHPSAAFSAPELPAAA